MADKREFLSAEWRYLAMLNYEVDPAILLPRLPRGTELDLWRGKAIVSVVGFMFLKTKILGIPVPLYQDFEEVNLRFYVRRPMGREARRAVVFVRELVPRAAIAAVARTLYNEAYESAPMKSQITGSRAHVRYSWFTGSAWDSVEGQAVGESILPEPTSLEGFLAEHYWGYTKQRDGGTVEYRVEHPRWNIWRAEGVRVDANLERLYGRAFASVMTRPVSAFIAEGSQVTVSRPVRL